MIEGLYFDEIKHIYYINGKRKTSASEMLKIYDGIKYGGAPARAMFEAAERGKRVHAFSERHDCDPDFDLDEELEANGDINGYLIALLRFYAEYGNSFYAIEEPFYSAEFDYCCRVDRIRDMTDKATGITKQAIVDYKTSSKVLKLRNRLQLTLYGIAVWGKANYKNYDYYIVHLQADGNFEVIKVEPMDLDEIERFIHLYWAIKKD